MPPLRRNAILVAIAVALATGVAWLLRPKPVVVEIGRVARGPLEVAIEEEGQTRIHPRYVIAAPVAGRLAQIDLDPGDLVRAGQAVARLAPAPLDPRQREQAEAQLSAARAVEREARARVAEAEAALELARSTLVRQRALFQAGQIAADALDRATSDELRAARAADAARGRAEAARFEVATARSALLDAGRGAVIDVLSPTTGIVLRLHEDSERVVGAGATILEIGDPADLEMVVEVLSTDAVSITAGAPMSVDVGGGRRLRGHVAEVEPAGFTRISPLGVEEQRVRVVAVLDEPANGVGDRYRIRGRIALWRDDDVLRAPPGAVFRSEDGWAAFRNVDGRARRTAVEVGHRGDDGVEILAGLESGDEVLLYPGESVVDGVRVRTIEPPR